MRCRSLLFACAGGLMTVTQVLAAPFCVDVTGLPRQCLYVDPTLCQTAAFHQGGQCDVNPEEMSVPVSTMQYCLVEATNIVLCHYPDRASCVNDAMRRGGACVAATPVPPPGAVAVPGADPYKLVRP
jgi:hypothetical protein